MPQLGGLDSCVAPSIILAQRVKEPLHLPFDFRCIGVHAALLPVWLRAEGLITYFGKTGKLFPAHSIGQEIRGLALSSEETRGESDGPEKPAHSVSAIERPAGADDGGQRRLGRLRPDAAG